jgi:hypothetical protein
MAAECNPLSAAMIIQINDYRARKQQVSSDLDFRDICGNTVRQRKYDPRLAPSPDLPDQFDNFNARDFIDRAYGLATQI